MKIKIYSIMVCVAMILEFSSGAINVFGEESGGVLELQEGISSLTRENSVFMGMFDPDGDGDSYVSEPVEWQFLNPDACSSVTGVGFDKISDGVQEVASGDAAFLLSKYILKGDVVFNENGSIVWEGSDGQKWCSSLSDTVFSSKEKSSLLLYTTREQNSVANDVPISSEQLYFLSIADCVSTTNFPGATTVQRAARVGYLVTDKTANPHIWWTRTSTSTSPSTQIQAVNVNGRTATLFPQNSALGGGRPAMNINKKNIKFVFAGINGKEKYQTGLKMLEKTNEKSFKITVLDADKNFNVTQSTASAYRGKSVSVDYSDAVIGDNICAILKNETGEILSYGSICKISSESGTVDVNIPAVVQSGNYTLSLFSEQRTSAVDYCSEFSDINLTVDTADNDISLDCGSAVVFQNRLITDNNPAETVDIKISNIGKNPTGDVSISFADGENAGFTVSDNLISSLEAENDEAVFSVSMDEFREGMNSAELLISTSSGISKSITISCYIGRPILMFSNTDDYWISVDPPIVNFGNIVTEYEPIEPMEIMVSNVGKKATGTLTISADNTEDFNISTDVLPSLEPESITIFTIKPEDNQAWVENGENNRVCNIKIGGTYLGEDGEEHEFYESMIITYTLLPPRRLYLSSSSDNGAKYGDTVTLSATPKDIGDTNLTYQWYQASNLSNSDGVAIDGATKDMYTFTNLENGMNQYFYCVASTNNVQVRSECIVVRNLGENENAVDVSLHPLYLRENGSATEYSTDNEAWLPYSGRLTAFGNYFNDLQALGNDLGRINVLSGAHSIAFENMNIIGGDNYKSAISISSGASLDILPVGINNFSGASNYAGIHASTDAEISISGADGDTLTVSGGNGAAAIGGNLGESGGTIKISGGTVKAYGGDDGAAIGSGKNGESAGSVEIKGGNIYAIGGDGMGGAGIGGGYLSHGGTVYISGGNLYAVGGGTDSVNYAVGDSYGTTSFTIAPLDGGAMSFQYGSEGDTIEAVEGALTNASYIGYPNKTVISDTDHYAGGLGNNIYVVKSIESPLCVTFDTMGGTDMENKYATMGDSVKVYEIPYKEGLYFKGWYTIENGVKTAFDEHTPILGNTTVYADWFDELSIKNGKIFIENGTDWGLKITQNKKVIRDNGPISEEITLTGSSKSVVTSNGNQIANNVLIDVGNSTKEDPIHITLSDFSVDMTAFEDEVCPFRIVDETYVYLHLKDGTSNVIKAPLNDRCAIELSTSENMNMPVKADLTIDGGGSLTAIGGMYSAGIGTNGWSTVNQGGTLSILGGTIYAEGGGGSASGIGGGSCGALDSITIGGMANVTALAGPKMDAPERAQAIGSGHNNTPVTPVHVTTVGDYLINAWHGESKTSNTQFLTDCTSSTELTYDANPYMKIILSENPSFVPTCAITSFDGLCAEISSDSSSRVDVVFAAYDENDRLLDIDILENEEIYAGIKSCYAHENFNLDGAYKVRAMVWKDMLKLLPLCDVAVEIMYVE